MTLASTSMIWNGQGPIHIGTYDPVNGRPEMGYLTGLYSVGCGNRTLTATPARETTTINESCSGQRLTLKEMETSKSLTVALEMVQFDGRTLAQAFYGAAVVKPAGTVTDEVLALLAPGDYFFLKNPRSDSVVIEDSTSGVLAALAAGMGVIGFVGGLHIPMHHAADLREMGVLTVFDSMQYLPQVLSRSVGWGN